ncbi:sugar ABC transporter substrate-binding protein [Kaistia defluvii]|uniref:Ribose transport system substrate-binding protein n=1 Tax=Kaistia defluvii TaxID=410841 RepID=A0ABV2QX68_9HYPH
MKRLRQVLAAAIAPLAIIASVSGAYSQDAPIEVTIGWAPPDVSGVFKTATDFFEKSAADAKGKGFDVKIITSTGQGHDIAQQVNAIDDLIQQQVDVIAVSPADVNSVKPALRRAKEAGIGVIVVNLLEPIEGLEVDSYIGYDNTVAAEVSASAVADYFGAPGVLGAGDKLDVKPETYLDRAFWKENFDKLTPEQKAAIKAKGVIIEGVSGNFYSNTRLTGFRNVSKDFPGIEIVGAPCAGDWKREKGTNCAEDFLQAHDDIDFIWAASNEMGLGAMLAAQNAGRLETASDGVKVGDGKVAIFTNDVTPESVDRIAEGKLIGETTHGFADWGWYGTKIAVEIACKQDVEKIFDIRPRTVEINNARLFYPDPKLEQIDWATMRANCKK